MAGFGVPCLDAVPREVGTAEAEVVLVAHVVLVAQHLVQAAETDDVLEVAEDVGVPLQVVPVEPCYLVVLAVGVVVALLRVPHLVAREHHRYSLAHHEHGDGVLHLPVSQLVDVRVVGRALAAAVPAVVVVLAVAVVLAVGFVVLAVVRHEVHHGESVVRGDEVDAGLDAASLRRVEVGRADDALLDVGEHPFVALQEPAHAVAELSVPLGPPSPRGERAHLIESACVPRLGYELGLAENGVVGERFQQRGVRHGVALLVAPQDGCQVEAEAVDVVVGDPVPQALDNHVAHVGVVAVQRVAASAEVEVRAVGRQHVVGLVVDAPVRDVRSALVALGGVVEHHVEHHLDAVAVQLLHHVLQLVHLHGEASRRGVGGLGCEESDVAVAPQVVERMAVDGRGAVVLELVELVYGHQLDAVHAQLLQVGNLLDDAGEGAAMPDARGRAAREVAHVHLVHDEVVDGRLQRHVVLPVEVVEHHAGPVLVQAVPVGLLSPHVAPYDELRVGVEQYPGLVEPVTLLGLEGAVHAEAVLDVLVVEVEDNHREHIAQAELAEEGDFDERLLLAVVEQHQRAVGGVAGIDREVDHVAGDRRAERIGPARAQLQPLVLVGGKQINSMHSRRNC